MDMRKKMFDFTFYSAGEIIFAAGAIEKIGGLAARFGRKVLLCTRGSSMKKSGYVDRVSGLLQREDLEVSVINLPTGEPHVDDVDEAIAGARDIGPDLVIGMGGGSALDTAKAVSGLAVNPGSVRDYLEGVGKGYTIEVKPLPMIAVPTTAGTGTEVTKNAVIARAGEFKKSLRHPDLIPRIALLDPELTLSVPARVTAESGMDALTQLVEAYVSKKAQPIPKALSIYGIELVGKYLVRSVHRGKNLEARSGMLLAGLLSGLALANSGLGAAHGIAAALGALKNISHGRACAMLLPHVMRMNMASGASGYEKIARVWGVEKPGAQGAIDRVQALLKQVGIAPRFLPAEIQKTDVADLVKASRGSSMNGNPVYLSDEQIAEILKQLL